MNSGIRSVFGVIGIALACGAFGAAFQPIKVRSVVKQPLQTSTELTPAERERRKIGWLIAPSPCLHNAYRSELIRLFGNPDEESPESVSYFMPNSYTGKTSVVRFQLRKDLTIKQIDYVGKDGEIFHRIDWSSGR